MVLFYAFLAAAIFAFAFRAKLRARGYAAN
jgi:hypothetical protein